MNLIFYVSRDRMLIFSDSRDTIFQFLGPENTLKKPDLL